MMLSKINIYRRIKMKKEKLMRFVMLFLFGVLFVAALGANDAKAAKKVKLSAKTKEVRVGETVSLKLKNAKGKVTWKSSDKKIATVKNGVITPVSEGTVKITAKNNGKKYTCKVTVKGYYAVSANITDTGFEADHVTAFDDYLGLINVAIEDEISTVRVVDEKGNVIIESDYFEADEDGLMAFPVDISDISVWKMENGFIKVNLKGYYNADGTKAFSLNFENREGGYVHRTSNFSDGIAVVTISYSEKEYYDYLINEKGEVLAKVSQYSEDSDNIVYEYISDPSEGMAVYWRDEENGALYRGCYNNKGELTVLKDEEGNGIFDAIWEFSDGLAAVRDAKTGLFGFIDKSSKLVIPCIYTGFVDVFRDGYAIMDKKIGDIDFSGVIDKKGNTVLPFEYDEYGFSKSHNFDMFTMIKDGKAGVVDKEGNTVMPFEYETVAYIDDDLFVGRKDGHTYLLNKKNKVILTEDETTYFNIYYDHAVMIINKEAKKGICNYAGKILAPIEYDDVSDITEKGILYAVKDGKVYRIQLSVKE